jgi:hypothetical protein
MRDELVAMMGSGEGIIAQRDEFRRKAGAFVAGYASLYQRHHEEVHSVARFRGYADLRRSPEFRALLALAPLGLSRRAAEIEARLRAQMERHCAGGRLSDALRRQPVCPDCGLALGDDIDLVAPDQMLAECRAALSADLADLRSRREGLQVALSAEGDKSKAEAVGRALDLGAEADPATALETFSPAITEWLAVALRGGPGARARITELQAFLRGKRLTRQQALRAFGEWLSAHGAANDADTIEFE